MKFTPLKYNGILPKIDKSCFVAHNAIISGDVTIGENTGIWYNVVIRGDVAPVTIGKGTNIQDGTVIHTTRAGHLQNKTTEQSPTIIGDYVTIGHKALIHACIIDSLAFIGMGAIILDMAHIEEEGMVAAAALVTTKKTIKRGEIWAGNPAKLLRKMSEAEMLYIKTSADNYIELANEYKNISL